MLVQSTSVTKHTTLINTTDTAIGDYLDKVTRAFNLPWNNKMPAATLEEWSEINNVDDTILESDTNRWKIARPLSGTKKKVLEFSFSGIRTSVESVIIINPDLNEEDKKSVARAAQALAFQHVVDKVIQGIEVVNESNPHGTLVVSGGVASNMAFRKM